MNKYIISYYAEGDARWNCSANSSQEAVDRLRAMYRADEGDDAGLEIREVYLLIDMKGEWK